MELGKKKSLDFTSVTFLMNLLNGKVTSVNFSFFVCEIVSLHWLCEGSKRIFHFQNIAK